MDNYYINQKDGINKKLKEGFTLLEEDLKVKIDKIKEELIKTNDYEGGVGDLINSCNDMSTKITNDLLVKIVEEIKVVEKNAEKWQNWYNSLKSIEGSNGYEWAGEHGFYTNKEEIEIQKNTKDTSSNSNNNFVYTDSMAITDGLSMLFGGKKETTTVIETTYYWTSYTEISIDNDGYIKIEMIGYKEKDKIISQTGKETVTIKNDSDYNRYYNERGSISLN